MKRKEIITKLESLGMLFIALGNDLPYKNEFTFISQEEFESIKELMQRQQAFNGWFTLDNVKQSFRAFGSWLTHDKLTSWTKAYSFLNKPKRVGLIMAGNIPLVGFHDLLCVLLSGNQPICKLSSEDKILLPALVGVIEKLMPEMKGFIEIHNGKLGAIEAVIATGSDNSLTYFQQYFGKYPHVFRSNRTSVAVLTGNEISEDLQLLGNDIFDYFGLGCRNVSHLLLPVGFNLDNIFQAIINHADIINHHKYANNYDYNKAVFLMSNSKLLDNNFVLFRETEEIFSPLAMVHYHFYQNQSEIDAYLSEHQAKIQVVVGENYLPFGQAQCPALNDYADGIDTMQFLTNL